MSPKYVIHANFGLSCSRLMYAYGLRSDECLLVPRHVRTVDVTRGYPNRDKMVHLYGEDDYRCWRERCALRGAGMAEFAERLEAALREGVDPQGLAAAAQSALNSLALNGGGR